VTLISKAAMAATAKDLVFILKHLKKLG